MAALDRISVVGLPIDPKLAKQLAADAIWAWYRDHADDVIFTKRIWMISVSLKLRDLRFLIERMVGPEGFPR